MGKGDKKSRKGKIIMGSYGNKRPRGFQAKAVVSEATEAGKPAAKKKGKETA
ncbi:30S ribosomal protein THX [Sphingobacterium spiritivorum]|uniref:30S ribosomal protein THX n=1 Tax=Sphingobacterium spiritivorum TaxID=258 RepID=UPI003DA3A473